MTDAICIIPARGNSTGLPKKNFKKVDGIPLVAHTIKSALDTDQIADVVVSTESEELARIASSYGAETPFLRPPELSRPGVLLPEVIESALQQLQELPRYEIGPETPIVVLQPNVPFTRPEHIDTAISRYLQNENTAIISVVEENEFLWRESNDSLEALQEERVLRSDLEPYYRETGAIYVTNRSIISQGDRVGDAPSFVVTDKLSSFEVNTLSDFWLAKKIRKGPEIMFRVDGGDDIGMGHVYRCLTLARELESVLGSNITFVTNGRYRGGVRKLRSSEYETIVVDSENSFDSLKAADADIIFVDVLDATGDQIHDLHETSAAIINLEVVGDGAEHADFVVNGLYEADTTKHNQFFGADYVVIDDEFSDLVSSIREDVSNVLLTFGGSDPSNLSTRIVRDVLERAPPYNFKLVLGPDFPYEEDLSEHLSGDDSRIEVIRNTNAMPELMEWADVAICSGGRTAYELCVSGTPSLAVAHNEREAGRMQELDDLEAIDYLGLADDLSGERIVDELVAFDERYEDRRRMSARGREFVGGSGIQKVLDLVHDMIVG